MTDQPLPELASSELDAMSVLWKAGALSAREVHDQLRSRHDWAYSTTRTVLERLVKKGHLEKKSFHGVWLYDPRISRPQGLARRVRDFAEKVLELDAVAVVPLFARGGSLSEDELAELTRLLERED
ncbi:MAG: BlaI/MecI/CopY family transcriptional regulator [Acidobacteriota bacterium]